MNVDTLDKIARDHGLVLEKSILNSILASTTDGVPFTQWAGAHLGPETLLTENELATYSHLESSGQIDKLVANQDLAFAPSFLEEDICAAIEELQRSTTSITRQTETLRLQQDRLSRLVSSTARTGEARAQFEKTQAKKRAAEKGAMVAAVEELSQNLSLKISDVEQQSNDLLADFTEKLESVFQSDDKLISSLQKLGLELDAETSDEPKPSERLRDICMRLIKCTVETVRTRLDRTYLEHLAHAHAHGTVSSVPAADAQDVREELESLYTEILPVAQMSVENEHLEPALRMLRERDVDGAERTTAAAVYVNDCMIHLQDRVDKLVAHAKIIQGSRTAAATVVGAARVELEAPIISQGESIETNSPARRRKYSNQSPIRPRANTGEGNGAQRRRSSGAFHDEPPLDALLRTLTLTLPSESEHNNPIPTSEHLAEDIEALANALANRTAKLEEVAANAQESFEAGVSAHLAETRLVLRLLRDSVLAESPFGELRLVDEGIQSSILVLAQEVGKVRTRVGEVDETAVVRSQKREELLKRWGNTDHKPRRH